MNYSLPAFSIRHPVTVLMLLASVAGFGLIACYKMPIKFLPEMDFPVIRCYMQYSGASPEQIEKEVAVPAEGEFRTIPGLKKLNTYCTGDGCQIHMRFAQGINMGIASGEVRDRIERLKLRLPKEVDKIMLSRQNANSIPIMALGLFKGGDEAEFIHLVRTSVEPRLSRVDGVAEVRVFSSKPEPEVLVEFDQNSLRTHNIALYQVIGMLQTSSMNVSVGDLSGDETKFYVRVAGKYKSPVDLANTVVSPSGLRLKDIASVGFRLRDTEAHADIDDKGGAFVLIIKESSANTVDTCRMIHGELERLKQDPVLSGLEYRTFFDQADLIDYALTGLQEAGVGGAIMAIIVLYAFLLRIRPTLVVTMAIPASLISAMAFMYFCGMTLNVITMVSLIVAVGMLVDDAIVVIENIYRHHQAGEGLMESSIKGASEVGVAVTASTLTILVVFVPVLYMQSGEMAVHMKQFALPICAALMASLFVAFTLIPLATSHMKDVSIVDRIRTWRQRKVTASAPTWLGKLFSVHPFTWLIHGYAWSLDLTLRHRLLTFAGMVGLCVATFLLPFSRVGQQDMPTLDLREIDVEVELEQNFDFKMTGEVFDNLKKTVNDMRDELGIKNVFTRYSTGGGVLTAYLTKEEDYSNGQLPPCTTKQALEKLLERIPKRQPGQQFHVYMPEAGGDDANRVSTVSVVLSGDESQVLRGLAEDFRKRMAELPNLSEVRVDVEQTKDEMQLSVDESLAGMLGVSPSVVARTVDVALRGNRLPYMKQGGREYPVWAQFREEDRKRRDNLDNVSVTGGAGSLVPLNQLVDYGKALSPVTIHRVNGRNVMVITGRSTTDVLSDVLKDLNGLIKATKLPVGYTISAGEQFAEIRSNMANFFASLLFAVALVYIVMAGLFESLVLPLSILTSVPIAFIGVYWGLYIMGTPLDTIGLIGCILMVGVVVRNGIVVVDHINFLREQGMPRHEALIQAGRDRFRPVIMTALTTILGVLPLAFEAKVGSTVSFVSLGRAFISGLTTGTVLTLVIVPLFYTVIEDVKDVLAGAFVMVYRVFNGKKTNDAAPRFDTVV